MKGIFRVPTLAGDPPIFIVDPSVIYIPDLFCKYIKLMNGHTETEPKQENAIIVRLRRPYWGVDICQEK